MHNIQIESVLGLLILGATVLAIIYHCVLYYYDRDKLLIHYLLYLFFTSVFIFVRTGFLNVFFGKTIGTKMLYIVNEPIQIVYLAFYFNFILQSIDINNFKSKSTFLYRSWIAIMAVLMLYAAIFILIKITNPFTEYPIAFVIIRIFIFVLTAIMLLKCYQLRHLTFQRYILYGCSVYFIFGLISFISNMYLSEKDLIFPPEWLMIGSFIDIVFFSIAMSYRNKKTWENYNKKLLDDANEIIAIQNVVLEKQAALENERTRIATDMHDDLGSGLTKIRYLSQIDLNDKNATENLSKIKATAGDLVENMSEIIWAMKEDNDSLEDLITYIKTYAVDYLEFNNISYKFNFPQNIEIQIIKGDYRRNIFLTVKEALHNIVKHAKATNVELTIAITSNLKISIHDNGIGMQETLKNGNGLSNMKKRIEKLNGVFEIKSNNGTLVSIEIPMDNLF